MTDEQKPGGVGVACSALLGDWTLTSERLPPLDVPVWVCRQYADGSPQIFLACRSDGEDGWLWANCYFSTRYGKFGWTCDEAEQDDDYQDVTHWMPLPLPPNTEAQARREAASPGAPC